jgi:hypothetical protein
MFEVIISSVITGQVRRKVFDSREAAGRHIDKFLYGGRWPRSLRNFRVEVCHRELPVVRTMPAAVEAATEAA